MQFSRSLPALVALLFSPGIARAIPAFFVAASGNTLSEVLNFDGVSSPVPAVDQASFSSGNLSQLSVSAGPIASSLSGDVFSLFTHLHYLQEADAFFTGTATIGALHASVIAASNASGFNTGGITGASSNVDLRWSDTVSFQTSKPGGSDFTVSLNLDDVISTSITFPQNTSNGFVSGTVRARVDLNGGQFLGIFDGVGQGFNRFTSNRPASYTQSTTLHVFNDEVVTFAGTLGLTGGASEAVASVAVDASDTARFLLYTDDPAASYTTVSGVTFGTPAAVPVPAALALFGCGLAALGFLRRLGAKHDCHQPA